MPDCDHCDYCVLDVYEGTVLCALGFDIGETCEMYQPGTSTRSDDDGWPMDQMYGYEGDEY